ncbi:MAG: uroporphyrinogen decarboxylase [Rhodospirillales bacterium 70-18]|nr:uroporphyrinogen decarboxylase [Rhodospirillales bacterium]OJY66763.1 MAG: uroporphyrinogen decarboxylase [Rhodospirillales bacterium 70-18]
MTKRLLRALAGEAVWPPPVWLMRQAGRYLPEYRALRAEAGDFLGLCTNPVLAAEVTLQPLRRFAMDGAILFSDLPIVSWALGQDLRYAEGEGPVLPPIRDAAGLAVLNLKQVADKVAPILETVRRVRAEVGEATLIGFTGGPFTMACYMVEGHGSREFAAARGMAYRDPPLFGALIDLLVEANLVYLRGQADAGAEALMLFDSWAGLLPPSEFATWVTAPTARIVAGLRESHPDVPVIGFPRLAGVKLGAYAVGSGVSAVAMDTSMDPLLAAAMVPSTMALQGNLDPLALAAGGAALASETDALLAAMRGRPFIFNLGHGIVPQTPPEHVAALVTRVRAA